MTLEAITTQDKIKNDNNYIPILDHGFVGIVTEQRKITLPNGEVIDAMVPAIMGSDSAIVQAARVSYGPGTKTVREDRGLIRYLLSHRHTSPFEMCEIKFHIKLPIFVMRQLVRHRTSNLNEISGRYSILPQEMYVPDGAHLQPQSENNKQGRAGEFDENTKNELIEIIEENNAKTYQIYEGLNEKTLARELSRIVLPVSTYTELYWKQDLHNLMHLLKLRMDPHAQYEIRVIADAMYQLIKPHFPLAIEAWEDYILNGVHISKMELQLLKHLLGNYGMENFPEQLREMFGLSKREFEVFKERWLGYDNS